ncbi:MAG: hypothetical protein HY985_04185 [Magnetospirillum sp.]|nr:hypothetical protein [Magnetospirillum sp.]
MVESTPFQLSRIYASGWSAGRKCTADDPAEIDALVGTLNPHRTASERERWSQGFKDAANHRGGTGVKSRRPA